MKEILSHPDWPECSAVEVSKTLGTGKNKQATNTNMSELERQWHHWTRAKTQIRQIKKVKPVDEIVATMKQLKLVEALNLTRFINTDKLSPGDGRRIVAVIGG